MDHKPEMGETGQQHPGAPTADFPVGASEPSEVNHKAAQPNAENTEGRAEKLRQS